jgi:uncharacterized linocin/CFP29 family protein
MNHNSQILQQGFLSQNQILDPYAMRPYLNARGESVVTEIAGMKHNAEGMPVPVFRQRKIHTNALLRKYEWEMIDAEVLDVMRQPLVGVADLLNGGLTKTLGGIGVSISTYEQLSDMSAADVSMSVTPKKGEGDRVAFTPQSIPVPIISKPFTLDLRTLEASRRVGESLDVTQSRTATIKVREAIEDMVFNGSSLIVDTFPIYGYTTQTYRVADTATNFGGADWSAADGNAHATIVGMIDALTDLGFTGPFGLYVNPAQYSELLALTGDGDNSNTQLSVILRTIPDLKFVRRSSSLDTGECVLVNMSKETVDLAIAMEVTPVSWQEYGGLVNEFRIMGAMVPRVKFDANNSCGVAHATGC